MLRYWTYQALLATHLDHLVWRVHPIKVEKLINTYILTKSQWEIFSLSLWIAWHHAFWSTNSSAGLHRFVSATGHNWVSSPTCHVNGLKWHVVQEGLVTKLVNLGLRTRSHHGWLKLWGLHWHKCESIGRHYTGSSLLELGSTPLRGVVVFFITSHFKVFEIFDCLKLWKQNSNN